MSTQTQEVTLSFSKHLQWMARGAAVVALACSTSAWAEHCAGGMDATGNECNGSQSQPDPVISSRVKPETSILVAKRAEMHAQMSVARARQRQNEVNADVKRAEATLVAARKAVNDAEIAMHR